MGFSFYQRPFVDRSIGRINQPISNPTFHKNSIVQMSGTVIQYILLANGSNMPATKISDNKDILIKFYKLCAFDETEDTKDNEILKRYKKILNFKVGIPSELILDISYTSTTITFITADFRKFEIPFASIKGWKALYEKDKFDINLGYAEIIFGNDKLFFPFEEVLYAKDPKYRARAFRENAPQRKKLGKKIRALRLKHNKRQKDIAGISEREVSRIELGRVWPSFKTQRKFAQALGISFKRFLNEVFG